jgi:hypothetical protein
MPTRPLTPAETRVVGALLDPLAESDRARIRGTGIPPRTFEAAASRLLGEGLVYDRYLPNPARFGLPTVVFALVRPYLDHADALAQRWLAHPTNALLWSTPDWCFGVFFLAEGVWDPRTAAEIAPPESSSRGFLLRADSRDPQVPIYFDFEGAWAALNGGLVSDSYPRPMPGGAAVGTEVPGATPSGSERRVGRSLTARPLAVDRTSDTRRRRSERFLSRSERRALSSGLLEHRVFLSVGELPPARDGQATGVALLHGRLREFQTPEGLLARLRGRAGLAPFLYATDERSVLIGALSRTAGPPDRIGPSAPARGVVGDVLREHLEAIEVVRAAPGALSALRDHEYARLIDPVRRATAAVPESTGGAVRAGRRAGHESSSD